MTNQEHREIAETYLKLASKASGGPTYMQAHWVQMAQAHATLALGTE